MNKIVAVTAVAAAPTAAAVSSGDPVFELIDSHRALSAIYNVACEHPDFARKVVAEPEAQEVVESALDALVEGSEKLLAFQAQTLRGVAAQLRYLSGLEDWQTVGRLTDDPENVSKFCATMATAIEAIIRKGAA